MTDYFANHARRNRFPWSLYHGELAREVAAVVRSCGANPRVLVVGCGLEPVIEGAPVGARFFGCDIDERAIEECRALFPAMRERLAVCPSPYELPSADAFAGSFDVVVAKEVIEHTTDPEKWARALAARVAAGGALALTTPNYGFPSTLPLLEATVLEWIARRDGYSRKHIHPSKFDAKRLSSLDVGIQLERVAITKTRWALLGVWRRPC